MGAAVPENSCCGPRDPDNEEEEAVATEATMEQNLDEEAVATFGHNEWMMLLRRLISTNPVVAEAVHTEVNAIMAHRTDDHTSLLTAMTHAHQKLELAEIRRQQIMQEAEEKTTEALASIELAQQALEQNDLDLQRAREKIKEQTKPFARGATDALGLIQGLLPGFANEFATDPRLRKRFHLLVRIVRDLVMLRCLTGCHDPKDRDSFLEVADQANGGPLKTEARAQLLLAYHKNKSNQEHGFVSNNRMEADRRGGPRKRRRAQQPGSGACSSHEQPSYVQPEGDDEFIDVGNEGAMSSCCAAAADEPMFVPLPQGYQESDPFFLPDLNIFGTGSVPTDVLVASGFTLEELEEQEEYWAQYHKL